MKYAQDSIVKANPRRYEIIDPGRSVGVQGPVILSRIGRENVEWVIFVIAEVLQKREVSAQCVDEVDATLLVVTGQCLALRECGVQCIQGESLLLHCFAKMDEDMTPSICGGEQEEGK